MARFMPRSNMPSNEARAGDFNAAFPDIARLNNSEWQIFFDDFLNGDHSLAIANLFDTSVQWTTTDEGTMTDEPDILLGQGHSLGVFTTDVTDTEGYSIQNASEMVWAIADRTILFEAYVGVEDVDASDVFIGINELNTSLITEATGAVVLDNGAGFRLLDSEGTGTWACVHGGSTGGVTDAGDAGTGADATITSGSLTNFVRLGLKLEGATPAITWYYNGVAVQTANATVFDGPSTISFSVLGSGAVEVLWIDYVMLAQTR